MRVNYKIGFTVFGLICGSFLGACAGIFGTRQSTTLSSLEKVDEHPLYIMHYAGDYQNVSEISSADHPTMEGYRQTIDWQPAVPSWGCSLFAALGSTDNLLYGRNFDWNTVPALLLFTNPPDGYASVSMVDLSYFGFQHKELRDLTKLPLRERRGLLDTPFFPHDGMNEHGLAIGMAAVPPGMMVPDPAKETIGSLGIIREILDHARDTDEAIAILQRYNINFEGGPPIHYLIADRTGEAVLVEYYQGEMIIVPAKSGWHQATNYLLAAAGESKAGICWRYDQIEQRLSKAQGQLTNEAAMQLLADVAQPATQWSVVYLMSAREVIVVMGQHYDREYVFSINRPE